MRTYCIDTSALIDGWRLYPPENFGVWDNISDLIEKQRLICPFYVINELEYRDDDLAKWFKEKDITCNFTKNTISIVKDIKIKFPGFKPKKTQKRDWADPWVIAIAIENEYTVISHETKKNLTNKLGISQIYVKSMILNILGF